MVKKRQIQTRHIKRWRAVLRQLRSINVIKEWEFHTIENRLLKLRKPFKL